MFTRDYLHQKVKNIVTANHLRSDIHGIDAEQTATDIMNLLSKEMAFDIPGPGPGRHRKV